MKCGTVHHFIPTTEATSFVSRCTPMVTIQAVVLTFQYLLNFSMRGEYDNELEWSFEGDIRVELLNWRADNNHHSRTMSFNRYNDPDGTSTSHVTDQGTADGYGYSQFISHTDLTPTTSTEYLRDDYVKLRVSAIVYSTPLLHLTPAWQDSLSTTQSGAQFTITEYSKRKEFNNIYYSPPFTTSPQGYRLCLKVFTNGGGSGEGSHSVQGDLCLHQCQHDDRSPVAALMVLIIMMSALITVAGGQGTLQDDTSPIYTNDNFVAELLKESMESRSVIPQFISQSSLNSSTNLCSILVYSLSYVTIHYHHCVESSRADSIVSITDLIAAMSGSVFCPPGWHTLIPLFCISSPSASRHSGGGREKHWRGNVVSVSLLYLLSV